MDSPVASVGLPALLAVIMFGLGLSLTVADFARVAKSPRAITIALACQLLILPVAAFGLVLLFGLPPVLAVGMLLLAASPGGTTANLFSHLFRGDVALNVSLTAVNSVTAVATLPIVTNLAIGYFDPDGAAGVVGLQFGKTVQVFAIVLAPLAFGMLVRALAADFAQRMDRPVRIGSALMLVVVVVGTIVTEREDPSAHLLGVGPAIVVFCLVSLSVGYFVPRWFGVSEAQSIACSMEIGIHNAAVAITIAVGVLGSTEMAVPAAIYGVFMFPLAACFGWVITRRRARVLTRAV